MTASRIRVLLSVVVVLLLGGCRLDADVVVRLDADGGGAVLAVAEVDDELAEALAATGVDPLADVADAAADERGWRAERTPQRVELVRSADDPAELEQAIRQLADGLDAAEVSPLRPAQITLDDETVGIEAAAALRVSDAVAELGVERDVAVRLLRDAVDYRVRVELPGEVQETNGRVLEPEGGEQAGSVVEWVVPVGEAIDVRAVGVRPRGPGWLAYVAGGVGIAVVLALLALTLRRNAVSRRRRRP